MDPSFETTLATDANQSMSVEELESGEIEQGFEREDDSREDSGESERKRTKFGAGKTVPMAPVYDDETKARIFTGAVEYYICKRLGWDQFDSLFREAITFGQAYTKATHIEVMEDPQYWEWSFKDELRDCLKEHMNSVTSLVRNRDLMHPHEYAVMSLGRDHDWSSPNPWVYTGGSMSSREAKAREEALSTRLEAFNRTENRSTYANVDSSRAGMALGGIPRYLQTSEITLLQDSRPESIVKFHSFLKKQALMGDATFRYRTYMSAELLKPTENDILSTAVNALGMDIAETRGWGQDAFNMIGFLDEYIRRLNAQGVTPSAGALKERFQGALFPILLSYHPSKVDIWPRVFAAYTKLRKSYGDYAFEQTIAPSIDLWVNVRDFWKDL
ncbi:MAG: hypothetical protein KGQ60_19400, partial [Planctomycetes bacterium]|nr:hypothetical protein [Planctomycetota bacterium]